MNEDVTVQDVMNREYVGVSESDELLETMQMMVSEDAESVMVLRGDELVGVMSERDVLAYLADEEDVRGATVADAMTESVPRVDPETSLAAAASEMSAQSTKRLAVTNGHRPLGLLTEHDVITTASMGPALEERPDAERGLDMTVQAGAGGAARTDSTPESGYEDQGICEVCGSLARDLSAFNGQLLCADCRDM
ncbi:CBS domain-containing protein [Haloarculaceae archaeon H-GB2-1]|nr:CBS domain-containing protein [Haloarculaceae archaeon H-GB1-1]MEA5386695.1 CBS domain-containing protein [Haloarculaceae archaeon H-GB11]MEA5408223.1 CBS domain-containing protein [Haloarculaceae archaeon H-GB2-1]